MEPSAPPGEVLQLRAVLRGISPLIWRRLRVQRDTSIAHLHHILQVAFGWEDMHLHRFGIRGLAYGIPLVGGIWFSTDAHRTRNGQLKQRRLERFTYGYSVSDRSPPAR